METLQYTKTKIYPDIVFNNGPFRYKITYCADTTKLHIKVYHTITFLFWQKTISQNTNSDLDLDLSGNLRLLILPTPDMIYELFEDHIQCRPNPIMNINFSDTNIYVNNNQKESQMLLLISIVYNVRGKEEKQNIPIWLDPENISETELTNMKLTNIQNNIKYTEKNIKSDMKSIQYELTMTKKELIETKDKLEKAQRKLTTTIHELGTTKFELTNTNDKLIKTNNELMDTKYELAEMKRELENFRRDVDDLKQCIKNSNSSPNSHNSSEFIIMEQCESVHVKDECRLLHEKYEILQEEHALLKKDMKESFYTKEQCDSKYLLMEKTDMFLTSCEAETQYNHIIEIIKKELEIELGKGYSESFRAKYKLLHEECDTASKKYVSKAHSDIFLTKYDCDHKYVKRSDYEIFKITIESLVTRLIEDAHQYEKSNIRKLGEFFFAI